MIRDLRGEEWKEVSLGEERFKKSYQISNQGRVAFKGAEGEWVLKNPVNIFGYSAILYKTKEGKSRTAYVHKMVAELFLKKPGKNQDKVLHKDYDKKNNSVLNLAWASYAELGEHHKNNPNNIGKSGISRVHQNKLTETQVRRLKKKLLDPNRKNRIKTLAKQFGVSEMQLYRIRSGENWGYIKVD